MTKEEFEELKSVGQSVAIGERSPDEFYELLAVNAGDFIQIMEDWFEAVEGELLVDIPEPGSDMARLLHANVMMRKYRIPELETEIERLNKGWEDANSDIFDRSMELIGKNSEIQILEESNQNLYTLISNITEAQTNIDNARPDFTDEQLETLTAAMDTAREVLK